MRGVVIAWALMIWTGGALAGGEPATEASGVSIYTSEASFEEVVENIKMAIVDRGMLVSGTLHVSDMLNRTAPDLGFSEVFTQAESVEFCSAQISHLMAQASPENIINCPFTIAVYVRSAEPGQVYVAFRHPQLGGDAETAREAIFEMLDGIVKDSL